MPKKYFKKYSPFHLTRPSFLPLLTSFSIWALVTHWVLYFYQGEFNLPRFNKLTFICALAMFIYTFSSWMYAIHKEATYLGEHTRRNQGMFIQGFKLFIASESLLFFSLFFAYFYIGLNPNIYIGCKWPPIGIEVMGATGLPRINLVLLLASGITVSLYHRHFKVCHFGQPPYMYGKNYEYILGHFTFFKRYNSPHKKINMSSFKVRISESLTWSTATMMLGSIFVLVQAYEYYWCQFSSAEGAYGSLFFLITGLHGFHVIVGLIMLAIQHRRIVNGEVSSYSFVGIKTAIYYWHFVDVVWIIVYLAIYVWPSYRASLF